MAVEDAGPKRKAKAKKKKEIFNIFAFEILLSKPSEEIMRR